MYCADCESIDEYFFSTTVFWLFLPTKETSHKLERVCRSGYFQLNKHDIYIYSVSVSRDQVDTFLMSLMGELEPPELSNTKITTTTGAEPSLQDTARTVTADILINRYKSKWIVDSIELNRYETHFQPIFSIMASGEIELFAHEGLFRMRDEQENIVPPSHVFQLAEYSDLLFSLDLVARRSAVSHYAKSKLRGKLFINFDPSSIYDPSYCLRATVSAISKLGIAPENVVFELTETHKIKNDSLMKGILAFYRNSGFEIALDDIGSGWSGLNMLHKFRPDYVKIDMDLIRNLDSDNYKQTIVKHLIKIAHDNGIKVIAEGIETEGEYEILRLLNVDFCQGFLFAKPKLMTIDVDEQRAKEIDNYLSGIG